LAAGAAIVLGAGLALGWPGGVRAATGTVVQAEGDAYAVGGEASLIGQGPIHVGPVSQALAYVPPNTTQSAAASLVNCTNGVGPNCLDPLVDAVNVLQSNADASISGVTAHCDGGPPGFGGNKVVGGSACVTIASAAALNAGSAQSPSDQLFVSGVTALSQMQGCDFSKATGMVDIASLIIGGTTIIGPGGIVDATPPANTVIPLGIITVILNEEHYDNQGHGFIVNAVHVFTSADLGSLANVDVVIGHAHSEDMCAPGETTFVPPSNPGSSGQNLPVGTKADSTKFADPGEVVTYTLKITTNSCEVVSVVDELPSGFTYVPGSASGDLGTTPTVSQSTSNPAIQMLEFYNPTGWTAATLTETLKAKVPLGAAPGDYVNNVAGDSSPPASNGSITCGAFQFSDTLPVNGPIAANNGNNPGIIVPRPGAVATATPSAVATVAAAATTLPNTGGVSPAAWAAPLALLALAGLGVARRRRTRA
jgi:uncharacterized repeat protein (TIGR01451 family)/LPXTG-motif cell wall-anchored protein